MGHVYHGQLSVGVKVLFILRVLKAGPEGSYLESVLNSLKNVLMLKQLKRLFICVCVPCIWCVCLCVQQFFSWGERARLLIEFNELQNILGKSKTQEEQKEGFWCHQNPTFSVS